MAKGKIIPFPRRAESQVELTDTLIRQKILAGEAELVGTFQQEGKPCSCYRLNFDHQTYYIFDLSSSPLNTSEEEN